MTPNWAYLRGLPVLSEYPVVCWKRDCSPQRTKRDQVKTVFVYINTAKEVGDVDHLKVFANEEAAEKWFAENEPEGVAFEYFVEGSA